MKLNTFKSKKYFLVLFYNPFIPCHPPVTSRTSDLGYHVGKAFFSKCIFFSARKLNFLHDETVSEPPYSKACKATQRNLWITFFWNAWLSGTEKVNPSKNLPRTLLPAFFIWSFQCCFYLSQLTISSLMPFDDYKEGATNCIGYIAVSI